MTYLLGKEPVVLCYEFVGLSKHRIERLSSTTLHQEKGRRVVVGEINHSHKRVFFVAGRLKVCLTKTYHLCRLLESCNWFVDENGQRELRQILPYKIFDDLPEHLRLDSRVAEDGQFHSVNVVVYGEWGLNFYFWTFLQSHGHKRTFILCSIWILVHTFEQFLDLERQGVNLLILLFFIFVYCVIGINLF